MSDSKDKEVESLIKNAISGMEYGSYHIINTNGPYWRKIEDLASTHGIFCQSCFNPIWICECYTKESMERYRNYPPNTAFVFPKKC